MMHKGLDLQALPDSLRGFVKRALQPGETIRWLGQPSKEAPGVFLLVMFLGAAGILVLGGLIALAFGPQAVISIPAMLFLGILLFILLGLPRARKRWYYTAYVVTDRRALIVEQGIWFFPPVPMNRSEVKAYGPTPMASCELLLQPNGSGDLIFETRRHVESSGDGFNSVQTERVGFLYIPDPEAVRKLVLEVARAHGVEPPPASEAVATSSVSLVHLKPAPHLVDPPRRVPFWIQRGLFRWHESTGILVFGTVFFLGSLIFIIPPFFSTDDGTGGVGYYF